MGVLTGAEKAITFALLGLYAMALTVGLVVRGIGRRTPVLRRWVA